MLPAKDSIVLLFWDDITLGAYGSAVLCRRKCDNSEIILKQIPMIDLNASERRLAINEVNVLSMLNHPNIVHYHDSFEESGMLIIEMEYADDGTLQQYLSQANEELDEREILHIFKQIVSALRYIHSYNILHRDLKTANIFLMKDGTVKMGDFGISTVLSDTAKEAKTVLGTPYYISPEMCESKPYDDKSDIWALGCILHEMASLQKTFEGSNLPALVNKIMKGTFSPISSHYSAGLSSLISDMLQKDPKVRPSANEIYYQRLPEIERNFDPNEFEDDQISCMSDSAAGKRKRYINLILTAIAGSLHIFYSSVLYCLNLTNIIMDQCDLPSRKCFIQLAVGSSHVVAISSDRTAYSWGNGCMGQLGHGNLMSYERPTMIENLKGKSIYRACCGNRFSIFLSENGIIMTCGAGNSGCLGHGGWTPYTIPRLIESLLSKDISSISCGNEHVMALTTDGTVFTWGTGSYGQLGLGDEDDR
ncbi:uncharacterized protein TRIADDRAFT_19228 [Trichoplax adhaerens]|uniref:non-specific serine/threonine protein kinase n=1 Tax=Trichoplax adhaerens TaxID=10228 RepID=B3RM78_TRIAD|nr:hypothetical protein TRIADDRAFT_19228 [Trichoplax adhaerens]EDV29650.1 hypothetical protein TRIADDRAFT_19228 [Trichoplax adhaerens]|eukprot:XP_002108852.1 hypothetical protein TRIADDRAFT_19228 [Trichoplax adhaerens]